MKRKQHITVLILSMLAATSLRSSFLFLLRHTDRPTPSTSRLTVLTPHAQAPVVSQATMGTNLLQAFQVLAQLAIDTVCKNLRVLSIHNVALTVEEPSRDLVLGWILDYGDDALQFFRGKLTSTVMKLVPWQRSEILTSIVPLVEIYVSLLADQIAVAAADTLDPSQSIHDLFSTVDLLSCTSA